MITAIFSHEVKNYSNWRTVFDDNASFRSQSGVKMTGVYQSIDNPNQITLIGEAESREVLNSFMSNPELKTIMEQAGVIGMPDIKVLNKA